MRETCPTFSWSQLELAAETELVVYPLEGSEGLAAEPALSVRLPVGADSWTPPADRCLRPGTSYAWSLRSTGAAPGEWSEPAIFEVMAPTAVEVSEALRVLRRYLAAQEGEPSRPAGAGERRSAAIPSPRAMQGEDAQSGVTGGGIRADSRPLGGKRSEESHVVGPASMHATAGPGLASYGLWAKTESSFGYGVAAIASHQDGAAYGLYAQTRAKAGRGVFATADAGSGDAVGVFGVSRSNQGRGVVGQATAGSGSTYGVHGRNSSNRGAGVYGEASFTGDKASSAMGVWGMSKSRFGVYGEARGDAFAAVFGETFEDARWAGYFVGSVATIGSMRADHLSSTGNAWIQGELVKGSGSFKIDHPLDPANRTLSHSFVESPDMMNVYNGNVVLDDDGTAWIELPEWFEALNRDLRYQLTALGRPAPELHVALRVEGNRFRIAGGEPGLEVSWQVTGIRDDAYARHRPVIVEEDKGEQRGLYLHPEAFGQPAELAWRPNRESSRELPVGSAAAEAPSQDPSR